MPHPEYQENPGNYECIRNQQLKDVYMFDNPPVAEGYLDVRTVGFDRKIFSPEEVMITQNIADKQIERLKNRVITKDIDPDSTSIISWGEVNGKDYYTIHAFDENQKLVRMVEYYQDNGTWHENITVDFYHWVDEQGRNVTLERRSNKAKNVRYFSQYLYLDISRHDLIFDRQRKWIVAYNQDNQGIEQFIFKQQSINEQSHFQKLKEFWKEPDQDNFFLVFEKVESNYRQSDHNLVSERVSRSQGKNFRVIGSRKEVHSGELIQGQLEKYWSTYGHDLNFGTIENHDTNKHYGLHWIEDSGSGEKVVEIEYQGQKYPATEVYGDALDLIQIAPNIRKELGFSQDYPIMFYSNEEVDGKRLFFGYNEADEMECTWASFKDVFPAGVEALKVEMNAIHHHFLAFERSQFTIYPEATYLRFLEEVDGMSGVIVSSIITEQGEDLNSLMYLSEGTLSLLEKIDDVHRNFSSNQEKYTREWFKDLATQLKDAGEEFADIHRVVDSICRFGLMGISE